MARPGRLLRRHLRLLASLRHHARTSPGPNNAADPNQTYDSCIALPMGGLGPLPALVHGHSWCGPTDRQPATTSSACSSTTSWLTDRYRGLPGLGRPTTAPPTTGQAWSVGLFPGPTTGIVDDSSRPSMRPIPCRCLGSPYPQITRAAATDPTTTAGNPVVVFPVAPPSDRIARAHLYVPGPVGSDRLWRSRLSTHRRQRTRARCSSTRSGSSCSSPVSPDYPGRGTGSDQRADRVHRPAQPTALGPADTVLAPRSPSATAAAARSVRENYPGQEAGRGHRRHR